jgi:hypothetical protein
VRRSGLAQRTALKPKRKIPEYVLSRREITVALLREIPQKRKK